MEKVRKLTVTLSMRVPRIRRKMAMQLKPRAMMKPLQKMAILPRKMGVLMVKGQLQMKETPQPNLMHRQKVIRQMM